MSLPPQLSNMHDVFHVSMLRRYVPDESHVVDWSEVQLQTDASYVEQLRL